MGKKTIAVLFSGCMCGLVAYGQSNSLSSSDRMFAQKAAEGGMAEVQLGQLAEQKASSQAVKNFGKRMATDHSQAGDKLKTIASGKSVDLPSSLDAKDKALYDKLSGMSGAAFDREYMRAMVRDHKTDVAQFQKEANSGHDQDLKSFASSTLPTLQDHLHQAQQVESSLSTSAAR
jgi:putative membrane protein